MLPHPVPRDGPLPVVNGKGFDGQAEEEMSPDKALDMLTRMLSGEGMEAVLAEPEAVLAEPKDTSYLGTASMQFTTD